MRCAPGIQPFPAPAWRSAESAAPLIVKRCTIIVWYISEYSVVFSIPLGPVQDLVQGAALIAHLQLFEDLGQSFAAQRSGPPRPTVTLRAMESAAWLSKTSAKSSVYPGKRTSRSAMNLIAQ